MVPRATSSASSSMGIRIRNGISYTIGCIIPAPVSVYMCMKDVAIWYRPVSKSYLGVKTFNLL